MLRALLVVSSVFFGSCFGYYQEVCYGQNVQISIDQKTQIIYPLSFTPRSGGTTKVLVEYGKSNDPRLSLNGDYAILQDLTEEDDGYFNIILDEQRPLQILELKILDCADEVEKRYGSSYRYYIPHIADFLEFTPINNLKEPKILWNGRDTDEDSRVSVKRRFLHFKYITQEDDGYYNFRKSNKTIVKRMRLTVKETTKTQDAKEGDDLVLEHVKTIKSWIVTFTPEGQSHNVTTIRNGKVVRDIWFKGRIRIVGEGIKVTNVAVEDAGTFSFRDSQGRLALTVKVEVEVEKTEKKTYLWVIGGLLAPALLIFCFCCCYCCDDESSEEGKPVEDTAEPPDEDDQYKTEPASSGPSAPQSSSTFSHQPLLSHVPTTSTATSLDPPSYETVSLHVNPAQPQVAPPEDQESFPAPPFGSNVLSSDSEPQFQLSGVTFPSAAPLDFLSTSSDVYNSDKFNFL